MARTMKDSGIEWIGQIPESWKNIKLKYIYNIKKAKLPTAFYDDNSLIPYMSMDYIRGADITPQYAKDGDYCKKSDVLVLWDGSNAGEIILEHPEGYAPSTTAILSPKRKFNERFAKYYLKFLEMQLRKNRTGMGIPHVDGDFLRNAVVIFPLEEIQEKISSFLDDKIGEVDTIITKTKESIWDYKKYKQSVITEAITMGLDKSVEVIDTDNIHIPKIPAHWQMKKMKYIFEIKKDIAGTEGYDILSITQKGIKIKDISKNEGQVAQNYSNYQLVDSGDFAMNHMDLLTGWVDISQYAGVTSPDYRVFRFIDATGYDADYYLYLMQMCYMNRIFYGLGQGVSNLGRWRLQADKFLNFTIPEPPLKEQQEIAKYLSARCTEIDALIAKKEAFVEEMETYKKSLIYEYVTGKKEVL